jgi:hypothetical protein
VAIHGQRHFTAAPLQWFPHLEVGRQLRREPGERARGARTSVQHEDGTDRPAYLRT